MCCWSCSRWRQRAQNRPRVYRKHTNRQSSPWKAFIHIHESCWTNAVQVISHELPVSYITERRNSWAMTSLQFSTTHLMWLSHLLTSCRWNVSVWLESLLSQPNNRQVIYIYIYRVRKKYVPRRIVISRKWLNISLPNFLLLFVMIVCIKFLIFL